MVISHSYVSLPEGMYHARIRNQYCETPGNALPLKISGLRRVCSAAASKCWWCWRGGHDTAGVSSHATLFYGFQKHTVYIYIYTYIILYYIYGLNWVNSNTPWFTPWFIVRNPWSTLPWFSWLQVLWSPRGSPQGIWGATWELRVPCGSRGALLDEYWIDDMWIWYVLI